MLYFGGGDGILHQHGYGHGTHASGHRGDIGSDGFYLGEIYIAAELSVFIAVHTHIDDHCAGLYHIGFDEFWNPHSGHQDISLTAYFRQIFGFCYGRW